MGACAGFAFLAFASALGFSRKVAGPVYAVLRHLEEHQRTGTWKPISLREGDCFPELADAIFKLLDPAKFAALKAG